MGVLSGALAFGVRLPVRVLYHVSDGFRAFCSMRAGTFPVTGSDVAGGLGLRRLCASADWGGYGLVGLEGVRVSRRI